MRRLRLPVPRVPEGSRPLRLFTIGCLIGAVVLGVGLWVAPQLAHASSFSIESVGSSIGLGNSDLKTVIINVIKWALGFVSLAAVSYMIYGGYLWLTAAGNEQRIEKAKQVILQAAIGIVIILMAWAIVLFVARTTGGLTNGSNTNGGGGPPCPLCGTTSSFNVTAIASCAVAPDYAENVPRSSAISLSFNTDIDSASVLAAVGATGSDPKLMIQRCDTDASGDADCSTGHTSTPKPLNNQVFSGASPAGVAGSPKQEWVAHNNSVTFYHKSFSTDPASTDNLYFATDTYYRLIVPRNSANTALKDVLNRHLKNCGDGSALTSIPGDHCDTTTDPNLIYWTFKTGTDTDGPPLQVSSTLPASSFAACSATKCSAGLRSGLACTTDTDCPVTAPDRNVPRSAPIVIKFNGAVDEFSVTTNNFRIYKFLTPPNPADGSGGTIDPTPLTASDFDIRRGTDTQSAWLQLKAPKLFDSFTWYKAVGEKFSNLCSTEMKGTYSWVFETNDTQPGVSQVYPEDGFKFACPTTKVFIEYNTSMWRVGSGSFDCSPSALGSYVTNGSTSPLPTGRSFNVVDPFDAADPYNSCKIYSFTPETAGLAPGTTYHVGVNSDLTMDVAGTKLNYGDIPPANSPSTAPWSFTVQAPDKCYQPPVVTNILPNQGPDGQCVSVIGDYFLKPGSPAPGAGDKLTLSTRDQTPPAGAWNMSTIVSSVDAGTPPDPAALARDQQYDYQVKVDYGGSIGSLTSKTSPSSKFRLNSGPVSNGICLFSLSPNSGAIGSTTTANGKNFGSFTAGSSLILASGLPGGDWPISSPTDWADTAIHNIRVAAGTATTRNLVRVQNNGSVSNPVSFDVTPPVTGAPSVVESTACNISTSVVPSPNPIRGDTQVCKNALAGARFTLAMNGATLNSSNIILNSCTDPSTCAGAVPYTVAPNGPDGFLLKPTGGFQKNTRYQVTITTNVLADPAAGGKALTAPYSWQFVTADTDEDCPVAGVTVAPPGPLIEPTYPYGLTGLGEPLSANLVDDACRFLDPGSATFTWTITNPPHVADLQTGNTTKDNVATDPPGGPDIGTDHISVSTGTKISGPVDITYDPLHCTTSATCLTNRFGESCTNGAKTSQCVDNKCTPIVTELDPNSGSIGTWTTIKGCWFGGYDASKSHVTFTSNVEGDIPNTTICGPASNTWTNERIVREVPHVDVPGPDDPSNNAQTGPVKVTRSDGEFDTSGGDYTVNTTVHPGLCRLAPTNGFPGDAMTVSGIRFGANEPAKRTALDQVNITKLTTPPSTPVVMSTYSSWTDTGPQANIVTAVPDVPTPAPPGASEVVVKNDGQDSNPWNFTVNDPAALGPGSCPAGQQCFVDGAANCAALGLGCGLTTHCCAAIPKILSWQPPRTTPPQSNICRNTTAQVTLSEPIDATTATAQTVRYLDGSRVANGSISVTNVSGQSTISYSPGLLYGNTKQQYLLTSSISSPVAVANPSFEAADASGVPTGWGAITKVQQSSDVPAGHSGFSAFGDCSGCTGAQQAFIAQNVPGTNIVGSTYRLTGWVKAEAKTTTAGLITRCSTSSNCGYDLFAKAPGLFDHVNSNGWVKVDILITKTLSGSDLLSIDCFSSAGGKVWCDDITLTAETTGNTLLRSTKGVLADVTGSPLTFTTGLNICTLDQVSIDPPPSLLLTSIDPANPASQGAFSAQAYAAGSLTPLQNLSGVYAWDWSWRSLASSTATVTMVGASTLSQTSAAIQAKAHGRTSAEVKAKVSYNSLNPTDKTERTTTGDIDVQACDNPWVFNDDLDGSCDLTPSGPGTCGQYNFQLFYCRGNGAATLLPDFSYQRIEGVSSRDANQLKSYFFKEGPSNRDLIGLLVFKNDELLSPYDWFAQHSSVLSGASSTVINGYPAVKTGTTLYIGVTNNTGSSLQGLTFVIDYNSNNASASTKQIYDQVISNLLFNRNDSSFVRQAIIDDTKRGQDLASIKVSLEAYKKLHGAYPAVTSGSYLPGFSTSAWPSWQQTLGQAINKSLPTDPKNTFGPAIPIPPLCAATDNYDHATCWSEPQHAFQCPPNSNVYLYHSDGATYSLYAHMNYPGAGSFASPAVASENPCSGATGSSCSCFNYKVNSSP